MIPDLFVFHRTIEDDKACIAGGASGVVVDLETGGKTLRQKDFDTEINYHSREDIAHVKREGIKVLCRSNPIGKDSVKELNQIIEEGADEIILPMVTSVEEVVWAKKVVGNQSKVGIMIETPKAVQLSNELDDLELSRIFIGLNDLRIANKEPSIFHPLCKGLVQDIRNKINKTALGFGGLTLPNHGFPLPVEYCYQELTRLPCEFTFLRRSFFNDVRGKSRVEGIEEILKALETAQDRSDDLMKRDAISFKEKLTIILELYG